MESQDLKKMDSKRLQKLGLSFYAFRPEIEQIAQERFAFLVEDKGFEALPIERGMFSTSFSYVAAGEQLGVEVAPDFRDTAVNVYLLRLREGELPPHGFVDGGERVRIDVLQLLCEVLHAEDEEVEALRTFLWYTHPRNYAFAEEAITRLSSVVARYLDVVLTQPTETLFPPPPPNASPASQALG